MGCESLRTQAARKKGGASIHCTLSRLSQRGGTPWRKAFSLHLPRMRFFHTPMPDFSSANVVDAVRFGVVKLSSMRSEGD